MRLRDKGHHPAFVTGVRLVGFFEVQAAGRILKYLGFSTGRMRRTSVTAIFEKLKLKLQEFQQIMFVFCHMDTPSCQRIAKSSFSSR
jgi:hypothetical protein